MQQKHRDQTRKLLPYKFGMYEIITFAKALPPFSWVYRLHHHQSNLLIARSCQASKKGEKLLKKHYLPLLVGKLWTCISLKTTYRSSIKLCKTTKKLVHTQLTYLISLPWRVCKTKTKPIFQLLKAINHWKKVGKLLKSFRMYLRPS